MPRIVEDDGLKERFANLQKLVQTVEDLPNRVTWEKQDKWTNPKAFKENKAKK